MWRESGRALDAFFIAVRSWRYAPMGERLGFDSQQFESQARMRKIKVDAELLDDLAVMESGVMEVLNAGARG